MLVRTHLTATLLGILLLINSVEHKIIFVIAAFVATFIPDIDTAYSKLGKHKLFAPLRIFVRHRGFIHSFSFLILFTLILMLIFPTIALGFFLGYSLHLFFDSFTIEGIFPFYPWNKKISGKIKTAGKIEVGLFLILVLVDLFFLIIQFSHVF
jgi:membrane-bound metal-dependent hydrolase YbcI (DUF457 family)